MPMIRQVTGAYRAALAGARTYGLDAKIHGGDCGVVFPRLSQLALPDGNPELGSLGVIRISPVPWPL